jgi:hypothetical protein
MMGGCLDCFDLKWVAVLTEENEPMQRGKDLWMEEGMTEEWGGGLVCQVRLPQTL